MFADKTEEEQEFHANMLKKCSKILSSFNIDHYLSNSALLGAYRDGEMIPWSYGAVLNVNFDNIKKLENRVVDELIKSGFKLTRHFKRRSNWKIRVDKGKFNIEITGYYKKDGIYERKAEKRLKKIPAKFVDGKKNTIILRGFEYPAPSDVEGFLDNMYIDFKTVIKSSKKKEYKSPKYATIK